jgi:hypothetical protein
MSEQTNLEALLSVLHEEELIRIKRRFEKAQNQRMEALIAAELKERKRKEERK